jgi:hypothetical protein
MAGDRVANEKHGGASKFSNFKFKIHQILNLKFNKFSNSEFSDFPNSIFEILI